MNPLNSPLRKEKIYKVALYYTLMNRYATKEQMTNWYNILQTLTYKAKDVYQINRKPAMAGLMEGTLRSRLLQMRRRRLISYVVGRKDKLYYYITLSGFVFMECYRREGLNENLNKK